MFYRSLRFLLLLLVASSAFSSEAVRAFVPGSLAKIAAERQGKPFIVVLWSVGCTHCPAELKTLAEIRKKQPNLDIVLVSTDAPEDAAQAAQLAARFGLARAEQWIFSAEMPERLRFEIDPRWHGELPRTQFYDREHRVEAISGVVAPQRLAAWARRNAR